MIRSEAHLDAPRDLVRVAHKCNYTGWLGTVRGVGLVGGVAQNGISREEAQRMIGNLGHDLYIVGPWEPAVAPADIAAPVDAAPAQQPTPAPRGAPPAAVIPVPAVTAGSPPRDSRLDRR